MALKRPPQHRVDAKIVYVHPDDDGWDADRIKTECDKLEKKKKGLSDTHPVARYKAGETRYDISLALPYLDCQKAWQFELRPLSPHEFAEVRDILDRFGEWRAYLRAAQLALVNIEGQGAPENLDECAQIMPALPSAIGSAAFVSSLPLTEPEGKQ